jgi:hypothetical protein
VVCYSQIHAISRRKSVENINSGPVDDDMPYIVDGDMVYSGL